MKQHLTWISAILITPYGYLYFAKNMTYSVIISIFYP